MSLIKQNKLFYAWGLKICYKMSMYHVIIISAFNNLSILKKIALPGFGVTESTIKVYNS